MDKQTLIQKCIDRTTQAYIKHGVTQANYADKVMFNPRKKAAFDKIESGLQNLIDNHPNISTKRDDNGNKESEIIMYNVCQKALVNSTASRR